MLGTETITILSAVAVAYLLGSVPTAILVCHSMGIADPRQQGSGNPGTTNVLRAGNRLAALITLVGDLSKGALSIAIANWLELSIYEQGFAGIAALVGHIWSIFMRFTGGKGVATMLGGCLVLDYQLGLIQCTVWCGLLIFRRISSLAAIGMALLSPALCWLMVPQLIIPIGIMCLIIIATHHQNIRKLMAGHESPL
ncbi:glycerol-3-phosphate 1-O-acyltransferase PlsY [Amphritea balenae]|uniref:Glycerol-3-phosphate acyltransferase n=1 Tax=Amphritea balenae TaxID=452629 RepID=A0A3P1SQC0_9GAMM|nr:glycerol-3-phosphate 1-O-acyltransferase PlsY [Amphritea balenae]RRC99174.1 glycerol-3-phosphate 1-O-acyltransferase [Amphritea balenae]GGK73324.1 glycerol-3-phosphate acyltransferase [Amphritea balenae]